MEAFQRRDLAILKITLPHDIIELVRRYHFKATYVNFDSILSHWSQLERKTCSIKALKMLAVRIEKFLLSSKSRLRLQGMSGLHRFILYSSQNYLNVTVDKLPRSTAASNFQCVICSGGGWQTSDICSCCHPPTPCYRCNGTGYSRGYYKYDVTLTKI